MVFSRGLGAYLPREPLLSTNGKSHGGIGLRLFFHVFGCIGFVLLGGCELREPYTTPQIDSSQEWVVTQEDAFGTLTQAIASKNNIPPLSRNADISFWWKVFKDEKLESLIHKALSQNHSLQIALTRMEKASGYLLSVHGSRLPQVQGEVGFDRSTNTAFNPTTTSRSKLVSLFGAEGKISWECDFFEKLKNEETAALATLEKEVWAKKAMDLVVIADVCETYFFLRSLQEEESLLKKVIDEHVMEENLHRASYQAGLEDQELLLKSQMALEASRRRHYEIIQESYEVMTVLSFLTTMPLPELKTFLKDKKGALPVNLPPIELSAPCEVLRFRPDLQEAERVLAASYALTTSAMASFYPSLSLSGIFGYIDTSRSVGQFTYGGGIGALIPLLNFGVLEGRLAQAEADEKEALITYRELMLKAFLEINEKVSKLLETKAQSHLSASMLTKREGVLMLHKDKVKVGLESPLELCQETRDYLQAQIEVLNRSFLAIKAYIQVMKALGMPTSGCEVCS